LKYFETWMNEKHSDNQLRIKNSIGKSKVIIIRRSKVCRPTLLFLGPMCFMPMPNDMFIDELVASTVSQLSDNENRLILVFWLAVD
jgi:ABC-type molybdenum transport system ATPase subunit/photorepair protein PhrA